MSQIPPPPNESYNPKQAKAQAKADKAHAKAMRPWYAKKRFWVLGAVVLFVIVGIATSGGSDDDKNVEATAGDSAAPTTEAPPKSEKDDVQIAGPLEEPDIIGARYVPIAVTNNSSKPSTYYIELAVQSPDGATRYDTTFTTTSNVAPGQTAQEQGLFMPKNPYPADAVVVVLDVTRNASN